MRNKRKALHKKHRMGMTYLVEILAGIVLMAVVFMVASSHDMAATKEHLTGSISYIKEQYNQHKRLTLASETKSIMRMIESAHLIDRQLVQMEKDDPEFRVNETVLESCTENCYISGAYLLNQDGSVLAKHTNIAIEEDIFQEYIEADVLLNTVSFPEKTYAVRIHCDDGAYIDVAATAQADGERIVIAYYYTPVEYIEAFSNSVESLLTGYSLERDGTIVVSDGADIIASNDTTLIGKSTNDIGILRKIREEADSDKLVHTNKDGATFKQYFGLMEHGRDYYVYVYMSESDVFSSTFQNMLYALIIYVIILITINMIQWRLSQGYREKQLAIQKEYTNELQNKNEQLEEALDRADRASMAKTNFLSRMSHDIRTPLNGIIGLLEIDTAHADDLELINKNREKMKVSANHLLSLINDVLQMSKLESEQIVFSHEVIHLYELAVDVLTIVGQRAAEAGITLENDVDPEVLVHKNVYGSPLHVRQIFLNIYGNCIKYNKMGGTVTTHFACLGVEDQTVTYRWTIEDTGVGMSDEFLTHIFEPFAQESVDARSVYNGTGLGMSIVKSLVDKMNGTIEVTSKPGVGSVFTVTLPFEIAPEEADAAQKMERLETETTLEGLHLLLVEDNALNAEIAETLLEDQGFTITLASDGQQAIDLFELNSPGTYDAILMDVMMPVVDGLTATRTIRAFDREDAKTIPIIAMTANAFDEDVKRCLEAGMNAHLSKPLQMERIMETLAKYCGRTK